jgi:[ribosomal protein S18]-alanine N-acetyltransferase
MHHIDIRWTIRRDMPAICAFEEASWRVDTYRQASPMLREDDFVNWLRQRNCIGMSAELDGRTVGSMVYALERGSIDLLYLVIDPLNRRRGVGRAMINKIRSKLTYERRRQLRITVDERNVPTQLFLRSVGIPCVRTYSDAFVDSTERGSDIYEFCFSVARLSESGFDIASTDPIHEHDKL